MTLGLLGKCRSLPTDMGVESGLWLLWLLPDWAGEGGRCFPESTLDAEDGFSRDHHLWTSFGHQIQAISKCYLSRSTYQEDETESLSIYAVCIPGRIHRLFRYIHACIHSCTHGFFDRETCWNRLRRDPSHMSAWRRDKESLVEVVSWDLKAAQEALDVPFVTVKLHKGGSTILWRFDGGSLPLKRPTCDLFAVCECCFHWGQYGVLVFSWGTL